MTWQRNWVISQPATSRNLKVLRERGLVSTVRQGTTLEYHLTDMRLVDALNMLRLVLRDRLTYRANLMESADETDQVAERSLIRIINHGIRYSRQSKSFLRRKACHIRGYVI